MRVAVITLFLLLTGCGACLANLPSGYYKYGKDAAKIQQRVFGLRSWSSILLAQIEQESGWRPCPSSSAGARGITQFIPSTQRAVERQYNVFGDICKVDHAVLLQSHLMRDLARDVAPKFKGFQSQWGAVLRTYNGSPRNFWREWERAGRPTSVWDMEGFCVRQRSHCVENWQYPRRILSKWPKYRAVWGA